MAVQSCPLASVMVQVRFSSQQRLSYEASRVMSPVPGHDRDCQHVPRESAQPEVFQKFQEAHLSSLRRSDNSLSRQYNISAILCHLGELPPTLQSWKPYRNGRPQTTNTKYEASWAYTLITDGLFPVSPTLWNRWLNSQRSKPSSGLQVSRSGDRLPKTKESLCTAHILAYLQPRQRFVTDRLI
jgi:hypothetical protein